MPAIMRLFFWLALAFFYAVSLDVINTMVIDADISVFGQLLSFTLFNVLVANLVCKYEKNVPTVCALLTGCIGVIVCGVLVWPWFIDMEQWLWVYLIVSLVVFSWVNPKISAFLANISAKDTPKRD
ncbi:hypothetical protein AAEU32_12540 [Pseudoalteromonas sp. SSDWG2]|uniref:hypothetical protein n=1 Tax=Pseudoalteromonas sp. SSDWG2 TaxID=3139391 RepID=UPI003BA8FE89